MDNKLKDGAVLSSNLQVQGSKSKSSYAGMFNTNRIYVGQIIDVIPIDDSRSRTKRFAEYNVLINEKGMTQTVYRNCRTLDAFGGENNFQEHTLLPITEGRRSKKDDAEPYVFKNGAIVIVGFLGGNKESPLILGSFQHPNIKISSDKNSTPSFEQIGSSVSRDTQMTELPTLLPGAKAVDGQRILGEFQGLRWNINKDGELTIVYQGSKDGKGKLTSNATQPTILKFNKDGEFIVIDNLDQEIKISRKDQKILISSGNTPADFIEVDRANKNITIEMGKDEVHNIGQNKISVIKKDKVEDIKGKSSTTVGGTKTNTIKRDHVEQISGTWRIKTGGEVVFTYPTIKLGSDSASEPIVLGTTWEAYHTSVMVAKLNALITAVAVIKSTLDNHTHGPGTYVDGGSNPVTGTSGAGPDSGVPGDPPSAAAPSPSTAYSKKTTSE